MRHWINLCEARRYTPQQIDAAIKAVSKDYYGFGGNCADFALSLKAVLGGGDLFAFDDGDHYEYVNHIALFYVGRYYDGSGLVSAKELKASYGNETFYVEDHEANRYVDNSGAMTASLDCGALIADLRAALGVAE